MARANKRQQRSMVAFRFRPAVIAVLTQAARKSGKTRTRIVEESILLYATTK